MDGSGLAGSLHSGATAHSWKHPQHPRSAWAAALPYNRAVSKPQITDDTFTVWRRSYKRLRLLESELVGKARSGEDPVIIARMYEKVEQLRSRTSDLFHLAQTAGMTSQIPVSRLNALPMENTPSEFHALHER